MEPEDEDNVFWRRLPPGNGRTRAIEAFGVEALRAGDVTILGTDVVHSVVNPIPRLSCTLQVYGGNFCEIERSEWDAETFREQPYDLASARQQFGDLRQRPPLPLRRRLVAARAGDGLIAPQRHCALRRQGSPDTVRHCRFDLCGLRRLRDAAVLPLVIPGRRPICPQALLSNVWNVLRHVSAARQRLRMKTPARPCCFSRTDGAPWRKRLWPRKPKRRRCLLPPDQEEQIAALRAGRFDNLDIRGIEEELRALTARELECCEWATIQLMMMELHVLAWPGWSAPKPFAASTWVKSAATPLVVCSRQPCGRRSISSISTPALGYCCRRGAPGRWTRCLPRAMPFGTGSPTRQGRECGTRYRRRRNVGRTDRRPDRTAL